MTDVAPARGRSSARGRGGFGSRGGRAGSRQTNGTPKYDDEPEDQGEIGELKKQFSSELSILKELFPDWTDVDLVFALQETNGDVTNTIDRISEGHVSKFADVPKTKDRSRSKSAKDHSSATSDSANTSNRSGRGRGNFEGSRGGRGRGGERGRGGFRGGRGGTHPGSNGVRSAGGASSVPTKEADGWNVNDSSTAEDNSTESTSEGPQTVVAPAAAAPPATAPEAQKGNLPPDSGPKKGAWASLFAKPKPAPAPAPAKPATVATPVVPTKLAPAPEPPIETHEPEQLPTPPVEPATEIQPPGPEPVVEVPTIQAPDDGSIQLPPSKDQLTEDNVEHLPDSSHPPPSETAAGTVASSVATPLTTPAQAPIGSRPVLGGFATSALKATGSGHRTASFQRKILEQQESVVMPGNHAVDRAAVQFGSMGLNGDAEPDVDDEREEAETRTQPPQHSPVQQPRTSLPPIPRQPAAAADPPSATEALAAAKPGQGLPPAPQQQQQPPSAAQQSPSGLPPQAAAQQPAQGGQPYNQFGLRGNVGAPSDPSAQQKPYDPFGAQGSQQQPSQFEGYPSTTGASGGQPQNVTQSQLGGFTSQPDAYSSYYNTSGQDRNAYNYYNYNQAASSQQQAGENQQRTGSAFGTAPSGESGYPSSQASQQGQSRYGEAANSGANTPNPPLGGTQHQSGAQSQQSHHPQQQQHLHSQGQHGGFPGYGGHPYAAAYNQYGYGNYMNQYPNYGQGFGASYGGKGGGMYGHNHPGYGMSPQSSYDQHSSSPSNVSGFGQRGHDNSLGGLGEYGRSGSTQPSQTQQQNTTNAPFSGFPDSFARSQSGYQGQGQYSQGNQQSGTEDSLKPFGESKTAAGASPSSLAAQGRPGSATNTSGAQGQSTLPPPQSHQQGFGGYPSHLGSQYGGLGGLGTQQQSHQAGGYGGFSGAYAAGSYNYNQQRGGWSGNYGTH